MTQLVHAAMSVVSFPATLEELDGYLYVDEETEEALSGATDLDLLFDFERHADMTWTAPRWMLLKRAAYRVIVR